MNREPLSLQRPRSSAQMRDSPPPEGGWMRMTRSSLATRPPAALVHRAEPQQPVRRGRGRRQPAVPVLQQRLRCSGEGAGLARTQHEHRPPAGLRHQQKARLRHAAAARLAAPAMSMPARRAGQGWRGRARRGRWSGRSPTAPRRRRRHRRERSARRCRSATRGQGCPRRAGPACRSAAPCPPAMPRRARVPPSRWRSPARCGRPSASAPALSRAPRGMPVNTGFGSSPDASRSTRLSSGVVA